MDIPYVYSDVDLNYKLYDFKKTPSTITLFNKLAKHACKKMVFTRFPYYNTRLSCKTLALKHNEGNCVAFAYYMKQLLNKHKIKSYIIGGKSPEKFSRPGYGEINHAAVIVPHSTGYILFDTAFYFHKAIVLDESNNFNDCHQFKNVYSKQEDKWCFKVLEHKIVVNINDHSTTAYYELKELLNPQKSITIHTNKADKTIFRCEINDDFTYKFYYKINLYNNKLSVVSNKQTYIQIDLDDIQNNSLKLESWIWETKLTPQQKQKIFTDVKSYYGMY
jgi:hypothetical protein